MRKRFAWLVVALLLAVSTVAAEAPFKVQAPSAVLMEASTGMILLSQGPDEKRPPASITKLMTMLLTMEAVAKGQVKLTDKITVSEYAASMGGSQIWLEPGEQLTLHDMLKAILWFQPMMLQLQWQSTCPALWRLL